MCEQQRYGRKERESESEKEKERVRERVSGRVNEREALDRDDGKYRRMI